MSNLDNLLDNNAQWAARVQEQRPGFFENLARQQTPEYLWIGCSDSRVPANQIVGLDPGDIFVHRNVANLVVHTDFNCLSVLQYAVEVLKVKHIIICGHYGCGGVAAALQNMEHGLIDNWLRNIKDLYEQHEMLFRDIKSDEERVNALCRLNVIGQVSNVSHTTIVQNAWKRGQDLSVHGWIYSIKDGLIKDLDSTLTGSEQVPAIYRLSEPE
ncbi:MAG TPA: carbonate dehydratase [Candidatus Latescibacteria bacterium]|jgi:carbonic anhydrase|nr:carbonate dehydratase [Candidatus Latescibacterota bacterium]